MDFFFKYATERFYSKQETNNFVDQKCSKAENSQDSYLWVHKAIQKPTEHLGGEINFPFLYIQKKQPC